MSRQVRGRGETRNKHENHFDLPLLIFKALFHIIQNVYRVKRRIYSRMSFDAWPFVVGLRFESEHVCCCRSRSEQLFASYNRFHFVSLPLLGRSRFERQEISFFMLLLRPNLLLISFTHFNAAFTIAGAKLSGRDYLYTHFWMSSVQKTRRQRSSITQQPRSMHNDLWHV